MRRRALGLACAAALGLPAAASAAPVSTTVRAGGVAVTLAGASGTTQGADLRDVTGLTVAVERAGVLVRPAAPLPRCRFGCGDGPGAAGFVTATLADLDGDGEPEVLVDRADGASVCCTTETTFLRFDEQTGRYAAQTGRLGSSLAVRGGAVVGDDVRYFARYAPRVAGVYLPVRVWDLRDGALIDVTRTRPAEVRRALTAIAPVVRRASRGPRTQSKGLVLRAALPAFLADTALLSGKRFNAELPRLGSLVRERRITEAFRRSVTSFVTTTTALP